MDDDRFPIGERPSLDPASFRRAMSRFATGVAIVTTRHGGVPYGMTINSLTSVSLDPCLLLICPRTGSATGEAIRERGAFVVNILSDAQRSVLKQFGGGFAQRFSDLDLATAELGLPAIRGSLACLTCAVVGTYPGGDHDIILGRPMTCGEEEGEPLVFHRGLFGTFSAPASGQKGAVL